MKKCVYTLVYFYQENKFDIVCSKWIDDDEQDLVDDKVYNIAYPPSYLRIHAQLRKNEDAQSTWQSYPGKVLYSHDDLSKVQLKSRHYGQWGNVESTDTEKPRISYSPDRYSPDRYSPDRHSRGTKSAFCPEVAPAVRMPSPPIIASRSFLSPPAAFDSVASLSFLSPRASSPALLSPSVASFDATGTVSSTMHKSSSCGVLRASGSTAKVDEQVRRIGLEPGSQASIYYMVSQVYWKTFQTNTLIAELQLQVSRLQAVSNDANMSSTSLNQFQFNNPLLSAFGEIVEFVIALNNNLYRESTITFLSAERGSTLSEAVPSVMKRLMSKNLRSKFNLTGTCGKEKFQELLLQLVYDAIRTQPNFSTHSGKIIRAAVRSTFKVANDSEKKRMSKRPREEDEDKSENVDSPKKKKRKDFDSD